MRSDATSTLRLLDAAANRAGEAARVVEDFARFVLDDAHLTDICKLLRHDLADALRAFDGATLCASRDTLGDVGCHVTTANEMSRTDARQVCAANFKRLEQSLRSLEEFSKLANAEAAAQLEQLRYRTYTLEKAIATTDDSRESLADVRLCVLVDGRETQDEFASLVESLVDAGIGMIQLRDKKLDDRELLARAKIARRLTQTAGALLVVNDRADIAELARADGVHLGQSDVSVKDARAIVGPRMLVGVSTHSLADARLAVLDGANYIGVGPAFASATKHFDAFAGMELLAKVAAEISLPAFAIGGIDETNIERVMAAGISRVAVSNAVISRSNPAEAARNLAVLLNCGDGINLRR